MRLLRRSALLLMMLTLIACQSSEPEDITIAESVVASTPAAPSV